jgi:hypothetical protein
MYDLNINKKLIKHIKKIIDSQPYTTPALITESHIEIFDFILRFWDKNSDVELVNIDFHHDMFNGNKTLDCGNWIQYIKQEINNNDHELLLRWITREESLNVYKIYNDSRMQRILDEKIISTDLSIIDNKGFDIIFLCRSDPWTPPHLDKHFSDLLYFIGERFPNTRVEDVVLENRQIYNFNEREKLEQLMGVKKNGHHKKTKSKR